MLCLSLLSYLTWLESFFFNFHFLIWLDFALPTIILKCDWIIHCLYSHALFWLDFLSLASSWLDIHLLPLSLAPLSPTEPPRFNMIGPLCISEPPSSNVIGPFFVAATLHSLSLIVTGPCSLPAGGFAPLWLDIWACHSASCWSLLLWLVAGLLLWLLLTNLFPPQPWLCSLLKHTNWGDTSRMILC